MMGKLSKFLALPGKEKRIFLMAVTLLPIFSIALRVLGYQRFLGLIERSSLAVCNPPVDDELAAMGRVVNSAANYAPGHATCLTRSMMLYWLLQRRGIASELRIGVRIVKDKLEAHAWVEYQGTPINDAQDVAQRFAAFNEPPSPEAFS